MTTWLVKYYVYLIEDFRARTAQINIMLLKPLLASLDSAHWTA